ncbi:MAG TPA: ParB/RepB/Spo0J family partition protein [Burkholderiales bacterium]|nr:ParB/RepB/Spo0J family partition protein [Burkholderiales bacterium]
MAKVKGLGRGLDALLGGDEPRSPEHLMNVALTQLRPGKYQPRTQMDPGAIAELAESIKAQGVIQPILARPLDDGHFEIIAGERRWRAARLAGLDSVPVLVREVRDDLALAMALIENIQREDLNPMEEAAGIQRLVDEFGMTHEAAAEAVGRSRSGVSNLLRLLSLVKPVQELILHGKLDMGHGRALLALSGAKQIELAHRIAAKNLSVRQAEHLVARALSAPRSRKARGRDRDLVALEEELADHLGMRVSIVPRKKGAGRLTIDYGNLDQLDVVLGRLRR